MLALSHCRIRVDGRNDLTLGVGVAKILIDLRNSRSSEKLI